MDKYSGIIINIRIERFSQKEFDLQLNSIKN